MIIKKAQLLSHASSLASCRLQDIYAEMIPNFWEDATAVILVYDVTRVHTLEACANWYGRILQAIGKDSLPGVLVANKMDLRERIVVKRPEGQQMAQQLQMEFLETSAQDAQDAEQPFQAVAKLIKADTDDIETV